MISRRYCNNVNTRLYRTLSLFKHDREAVLTEETVLVWLLDELALQMELARNSGRCAASARNICIFQEHLDSSLRGPTLNAKVRRAHDVASSLASS